MHGARGARRRRRRPRALTRPARVAAQGFSGADLSALVREAAMASLRDSLARERDGLAAEAACVAASHFERAFDKVFPSVSPRDRRMYASLRHKLRRVRMSKPAAGGGADGDGGDTPAAAGGDSAE